jgi:hypothetical protein
MKLNTKKFKNTSKNQLVKSRQSLKSIKLRSFSPLLNKELQIRSLKTLRPNSLKLCDGLLNLRINKNDPTSCKPYNNYKVQELLLHNLKSSMIWFTMMD